MRSRKQEAISKKWEWGVRSRKRELISKVRSKKWEETRRSKRQESKKWDLKAKNKKFTCLALSNNLHLASIEIAEDMLNSEWRCSEAAHSYYMLLDSCVSCILPQIENRIAKVCASGDTPSCCIWLNNSTPALSISAWEQVFPSKSIRLYYHCEGYTYIIVFQLESFLWSMLWNICTSSN